MNFYDYGGLLIDNKTHLLKFVGTVYHPFPPFEWWTKIEHADWLIS